MRIIIGSYFQIFCIKESRPPEILYLPLEEDIFFRGKVVLNLILHNIQYDYMDSPPVRKICLFDSHFIMHGKLNRYRVSKTGADIQPLSQRGRAQTFFGANP